MIVPLAKLGAYFSFPGYYMREAKDRQREAFTQAPSDRLLIETDAPDQLLPEEFREHTLDDPEGHSINHPANLGAIYRFMAKMWMSHWKSWKRAWKKIFCACLINIKVR